MFELDPAKLGNYAAISTLIQSIGEQMDRREWLWNHVWVSGKLRVNSEFALGGVLEDEIDSGIEIPGSLNMIERPGMYRGEDELGEYLLLNEPLKMLLTAPVLDGEHKRLAFSFQAVEAGDDESGYAVIESDEGDYIMYPEDILDVRFRYPSDEAIHGRLQRNFPELVKALEKIDVNPGRSDRTKLRILRDFKIPSDTEAPAEILMQIGRQLYERLSIDKEIDYELTIHGVIEGMAEDEDIIETEEILRNRLRGYITTIDLRLDGDYFAPSFIIAEPSAARHGFELRVVPISSVEAFNSMRPRRRRFGRVAMANFTAPEEVYDRWRIYQDEIIETEESGTKTIEAATDPKLLALDDLADLADFALEVKDIRMPFFNEKQGYYEYPLTLELEQIVRAYQQYSSALKIQPETIPTALSSDFIRQLKGAELKVGDRLVVSRHMNFLYVKSPHEVEPFTTEENVKLIGDFVEVIQADFPAPERSKEPFVSNLAIVINNAELFTEDGDSHIDLSDGVIVMQVISAQKPRFAHIEYATPPTGATLD